MAFISGLKTYRGRTWPTLPVAHGIRLGFAFYGDGKPHRLMGEARRTMPHSFWEERCVVLRDGFWGGRKSAAALACQVSRSVVAAAHDTRPEQIGALIYCHETADERLSDSTVGRIQQEVGLPNAFAFSVSQCHNASPFAALSLALALMEGPERIGNVLIASSDKQVFPLQRMAPNRITLSDAAAALLLSQTPAGGWRLLHAASRQCHAPVEDGASGSADSRRALAAEIAAVIKDAAEGAGHGIATMEVAVACGASREMMQEVDRCLGRTTPSVSASGARFSSPVDPLFAIRTATEMAKVSKALVWGIGNNGETGCCILEKQ